MWIRLWFSDMCWLSGKYWSHWTGCKGKTLNLKYIFKHTFEPFKYYCICYFFITSDSLLRGRIVETYKTGGRRVTGNGNLQKKDSVIEDVVFSVAFYVIMSPNRGLEIHIKLKKKKLTFCIFIDNTDLCQLGNWLPQSWWLLFWPIYVWCRLPQVHRGSKCNWTTNPTKLWMARLPAKNWHQGV